MKKAVTGQQIKQQGLGFSPSLCPAVPPSLPVVLWQRAQASNTAWELQREYFAAVSIFESCKSSVRHHRGSSRKQCSFKFKPSRIHLCSHCSVSKPSGQRLSASAPTSEKIAENEDIQQLISWILPTCLTSNQGIVDLTLVPHLQTSYKSLWKKLKERWVKTIMNSFSDGHFTVFIAPQKGIVLMMILRWHYPLLLQWA